YETMAVNMGLPRFLPLISDADLDISAQPTTKIQFAIVCLEMTLTSTLRTLGFVPDVVIGHSFGEYTALNAGCVLSTSDVLYLVGRRAMLIKEYLRLGMHAILATKSDAPTIRRSIVVFGTESCDIACINTPPATVVSGQLQEVERFHLDLKKKDSRANGKLLKVPYGFHLAQLDPVLDKLLEIAKVLCLENQQLQSSRP
ncbi:acyl transferase domain-containing protein, partial [Diaporthe sp. PMI_573]